MVQEVADDLGRELDVVWRGHAQLERDHAVAKAHGQAELVGDLRVERCLVLVEVTCLKRQQVVEAHDLLAHDDLQVLGVDDVLVLGSGDGARHLEERLVVPLRVEVGELARHSVVLAQPHRVHRREERVVLDARVARLEDLARALSRREALLVEAAASRSLSPAASRRAAGRP